MEERLVHDVACTVCGCVCDDLVAHVSGARLTSLDNACPLAEPWFAGLNDCQPPEARVNGHPVDLHAAEERACEILLASRAPLIFGLSRSSTAGQRAAVRLADRIGANIDTTASVCHGPSIMAIQQVGESTCSLGEARNRADLVLFWGADPLTTHPRHLERYSVDAQGMIVPDGRANRTVVVVDSQPTMTGQRADCFFAVARQRQFELLWSLRQVIRGQDLPANADPGLPALQVRELARLLTGCRYGVVFFGLGLAQSEHGHALVEALLRLVAELNQYTRFAARRLRVPGDVAGADCVLCWETGFPFAVNLARGYPRYNPLDYSANSLLARREVDTCLFVGSESVVHFSPAAQAHLSDIPTIVLDYPHITPRFTPTVHFVTSVYGVHQPGTAYRMDEVPIPLRAFLPSTYASDQELLTRFLARYDILASRNTRTE